MPEPEKDPPPPQPPRKEPPRREPQRKEPPQREPDRRDPGRQAPPLGDPPKTPRQPPRIALIATGGYGRRELSPRSDVDLLALLPSEDLAPGDRARADTVAERLHRALWDAGLEAGFAARPLGQTLELAREDHTARTALLDCRLVCGDPALFKDLERAMVTELEPRKVEEFIQEKLEELQVRRKRYGGSVWLLEPHLKQGKGGLRDLQAALWIARVRHKVAGLGEAGGRGLLPPRGVKEAPAAGDPLRRPRHQLHHAT